MKFVKKLYQQTREKANTLKIFMERWKCFHVMCATKYLDKIFNWLRILKIITRKVHKISNVTFVKSISLDQEVWRTWSTKKLQMRFLWKILHWFRKSETSHQDNSWSTKKLQMWFLWKILYQSGHLKIHIKTHEGQRNFKCDTCGKFFTQSGALKKHIQTIHEGKRNHKCDSCGKFFFHSETLMKHIKTIHEGQKNYICDSCGKSFSQSGDLKKHIKTIH